MKMMLLRKMKTSGDLNGKSINKLFSFFAFSFSTFLSFSFPISSVGCASTTTSIYTSSSPYFPSSSPPFRDSPVESITVSKVPVSQASTSTSSLTTASIPNPLVNNKSIFSKASTHPLRNPSQSQRQSRSQSSGVNQPNLEGDGSGGNKIGMMMTNPGKFLRIRRSLSPNPNPSPNTNTKLHENSASSLKPSELLGSNYNNNNNGDNINDAFLKMDNNEKSGSRSGFDYPDLEGGIGMGLGLGNYHGHQHGRQLHSEDDIMRLLSQIIKNTPKSPLNHLNGAGEDSDAYVDTDTDTEEPLELESLFAGKNPLLGQVQIQRQRHGQGQTQTQQQRQQQENEDNREPYINIYSDEINNDQEDDPLHSDNDDGVLYDNGRKIGAGMEPGNLNEWMDVDVETPLPLFKHRVSTPFASKTKSKAKAKPPMMMMRMRRGGIGAGSLSFDLLRNFLYMPHRN